MRRSSVKATTPKKTSIKFSEGMMLKYARIEGLTTKSMARAEIE